MSRTNGPCPLLHLPIELIPIIAEFLETPDLNALLQTSAPLTSLLDRYLWDRAIKLMTKSKRIPVESKNKVLSVAAREGHESVIKPLIDIGADLQSVAGIQITDTYTLYQTALSHAVIAGHTAVVRTLLELGADATATDKLGNPALLSATEDASIASLVLKYGADPEAADLFRGQTALHRAAWDGQVEVVKVLLEHGANVSVRDGLGHTPLHCAVENGSEAVVKILLSWNVDVEAANDFARDFADNLFHGEISDLLESYAKRQKGDPVLPPDGQIPGVELGLIFEP